MRAGGCKMKAPERIYRNGIEPYITWNAEPAKGTTSIEYIRADLVPDCDSQDCPYKRAFKVEIGGK